MDEFEKYHLEHEEETKQFLESDSFKKIKSFLAAENEAREKAGIKGNKGSVEFTCPLCGGLAISERYPHNSSFHGGSQCLGCKISCRI